MGGRGEEGPEKTSLVAVPLPDQVTINLDNDCINKAHSTTATIPFCFPFSCIAVMMVSSMSGCWAAIVLIMTIGPSASGQQLNSCRTGHGLKYLSGDALAPDDQNGCLGPDDTPYPT